ncbi:MAG: hypothetical protein D3913_11305 [Candidatus Electrothrix sp. LOE1_4_5]|nr:hypothetical protein [Candidatus Electrothrix gigas]
MKRLLFRFYDGLEFYRELLEDVGIFREDIENIDSLEFVERLPVLDKSILKENLEGIKRLSE